MTVMSSMSELPASKSPIKLGSLQGSSLSPGGSDGTSGGAGYRARRYALKFDPPCIFLEYEDADAKRRVRAVKINKVAPGVDVERLTRKVIRSFPRKLDLASVKYEQVRKLVSRLVQHQTTQMQALQTQSSQTLDVEPPLMPALSPKLPGGITQKLVMSDPRASLESRFSTSTVDGGVDAGDDLDTALMELDKELGVASSIGSDLPLRTSSVASPAMLSRDGSFCIADRAFSSSAGGPAGLTGPGVRLVTATCTSSITQQADPAHAKTRFAQEAEKLVLEFEVEGDVDLNQVSEVELKMAKLKMEEAFLQNQIKPGDPRYEYDKQVEFGPATSANDWDCSGDEEEEEQAEAAASSADNDISDEVEDGQVDQSADWP